MIRNETSDASKFLQWLKTDPFARQFVQADATWGDIFYTQIHNKSPIFLPSNLNTHDQYLGFGSRYFASLLAQFLLSLDIQTQSFDYEPKPVDYTGVTTTILDRNNASLNAREVQSESGVDNLLPLILNHPDLDLKDRERLLRFIQNTSHVRMMGCISPSSMIAFIKRLTEMQSRADHIHLYELSRTIPIFIKLVMKYLKINQKYNIYLSTYLEDLSISPNPVDSLAKHAVNLEQSSGETNITVADIIEYYMNDNQIIDGLGGHLRLFGSNGLVFIRCLAQHQEIEPQKKIIVVDPAQFSSSHKMLWRLLKNAGFEVTPELFAHQMDNLFPPSAPPLRGFADLCSLFDQALTTERIGFPKLRRVFAAPIVKKGMDPEQRYFVLLAYEPVETDSHLKVI